MGGCDVTGARGGSPRGHGSKILFVALIVGCVIATVSAPSPVAAATDDPRLESAVSAGGAGPDSGDGVAVDASGNAVVTGSFSDAATFGAGDHQVSLTSAGESDVYVARYTADGILDWAVSAGGTATDVGSDVEVDAAGNAVVTGHFSGTATFGAGDQQVTLTSTGGDDVFVARYTADGTLDWAVSAGGTARDSGIGLGADDAGNVVVTGSYQYDATFGTGDGKVTLTGDWPYGGSVTNVFVARYTPEGTLDWAIHSVGNNFGRRYAGADVAVGDDGSVVVTGSIGGSVRFEPSGQQINIGSDPGFESIFIARLRIDGTFDWAVGIPGGPFSRGMGVAVDRDGSAVVTGFFYGSTAFGADDHRVFLTDGPDADATEVFLARYAADGTLDWATSAGSPGEDAGLAVAVDDVDRPIVSGRFTGTATFGADDSQVTLTSAGDNDAFVARYNEDGTLNSAVSAGGSGNDFAGSVAVDTTGRAVVGGTFSGAATFGAGDRQVTLTSAGETDAFLARYDWDNAAPRLSLPTLSPDPTPVGTAVNVTAEADDSAAGGSDIGSGQYRWRADGSASWSSWTPMAAADGAFEGPIETMEAGIEDGFPSAGVYEVCVRASDTAGNTSDGTSCAFVAAYDPAAGFTVGSGSVDSPASADPVNGAAGPASFAFVSKYAKGKTTPDGALQFNFRDGDLTFRSTGQAWLVITGEPRAHFQGAGVLNNSVTCEFTVDAWDGSHASGGDAFGLRIFDCDGGTGARYSLNARPLTRGDIMINRK